MVGRLQEPYNQGCLKYPVISIDRVEFSLISIKLRNQLHRELFITHISGNLIESEQHLILQVNLDDSQYGGGCSSESLLLSPVEVLLST
ncbi:unnamed protein product [[Candida] boidinii]|nr:unnamed protein product [[Candida] boidinii]